MRKYIGLVDGWEGMLTQTDSESEMALGLLNKPFKATIPGCVHTDLIAAGLIPDPFLPSSEKQLEWIGFSQWTYTTDFYVDDNLLSFENIELYCKGIDTIASIYLNGSLIGKTQSQHIEYRFNLQPYIITDKNVLQIVFESPIKYARNMQKKLGDLPKLPLEPYNFIRKSACNFGWDWGVTLTTVGIWRTIGINAWNQTRFESVRPLSVQANKNKAIIDCHIDLPKKPETPLELQYVLQSPTGKNITGISHVNSDRNSIEIIVDEPELWWPVGYGEQPLYTLELKLGDEDRWQGKIGLREVTLITTPDKDGSEFTLSVNGKRIFCKGANWIPDDVFFTEVTRERYEERIRQAIDANMNMLRVWGGGIYENDEFYDICDRLGILVWQDFLFACAAYPEEAPFDKLVEVEAEQNIARLSHHPSLVLWSGCNENLWAYTDWTYKGVPWKEFIAGKTWGLGYYLNILPKAMEKLDTSRPYWPGSPYSGNMQINPNNPAFGDTHTWEPFTNGHFSDYAHEKSRFCSEFGFQGPMSMSLITRYVPQNERYYSSPSMCHYQRNFQDTHNTHILNHMEKQFNISKDLTLDEWVYLGQVTQGRAIQHAIGRFRSDMPYCMGTLFWQFNDCWPVMSWAAIEYMGRKKLLWYMIRNLYSPKLMTIQSRDGLKLCFVNDTDFTQKEEIIIRLMNFDGTILDEESLCLQTIPRECVQADLPTFCISPDNPDNTFIIAENQNCLRAFWYYCPDKELNYPYPKYEIIHNREDITIEAKSFLRDMALRADRLEDNVEINTQMITLLPGEKFTFKINAKNKDVLSANYENMFSTVNFYGKNAYFENQR